VVCLHSLDRFVLQQQWLFVTNRVLFNSSLSSKVLVLISFNNWNYLQKCRMEKQLIRKLNRIVNHHRLHRINHAIISFDCTKFLSQYSLFNLFLLLAIIMKIMKVWSIVRSIWNCMQVMSIRLCRIITIDMMLLWKVRRCRWHFMKTFVVVI
jgi:hypothetical protein